MQGSDTGVIPMWGWGVFGVAVVVMLVIDLLAHRGDKAETRKNAGIWTAIWIVLGLSFTLFVWQVMGGSEAREYLAVYTLEKSLSLDNLFVFYIIFHSLNIPQKYHHKVLYWGIIGALAFRAVFIFAGVALVEQFAWVEYVFGGILLYAAWRTYREDPTEQEESRIVNWLEYYLPLSSGSHGGRFFARVDGRRVATVLFVALAAIELTDVLFAIDSVAAALAVTRQEFVLYSANIFAILGLRSLYLLLESLVVELKYLHYGLAAVLGFAALKLLFKNVLDVPPLASVGIIVVIIGIAVWASLRARPEDEARRTRTEEADGAV